MGSSLTEVHVPRYIDKRARVCFNGDMTNHTDTQYPRVLDITQPKRCLATKCDRCGGKGIYHIYGVCFRCGGNGSDPTHRDWGYPAAWTDEQCAEFVAKREERNAKARKRQADKAEALRQEKFATNRERWSITLDAIAQMLRDGEADFLPSFALDIYSQASTRTLTDNQGNAMAKAVEQARQKAQDRANRPEAQPVPTGRVEVEGKIVSLKWYESEYGATQKMVLLGDDGWRLFVTVPSKLSVEFGDRVKLTATITQSDDDPTFGFGKRPTKAEVIDA